VTFVGQNWAVPLGLVGPHVLCFSRAPRILVSPENEMTLPRQAPGSCPFERYPLPPPLSLGVSFETGHNRSVAASSVFLCLFCSLVPSQRGIVREAARPCAFLCFAPRSGVAFSAHPPPGTDLPSRSNDLVRQWREAHSRDAEVSPRILSLRGLMRIVAASRSSSPWSVRLAPRPTLTEASSACLS